MTKTMQPHQERVVKERADLAEKTEKLKGFLFGKVFSGLEIAEQKRLIRQSTYMGLYLEVLDERIAAFLEAPATDQANRTPQPAGRSNA